MDSELSWEERCEPPRTPGHDNFPISTLVASGLRALQETDTTDCSCMELYNKNNKIRQPARHSTLRSYQSHPRVNTCAKCRKRKPGNPKNPQHCPSCLCPPDVVRSSSGRLRGTENMEDVLARFEEITRDPREPGPNQPSNVRSMVTHQKNGATKINPRKSSSLSRQQRQNEHDRILDALYRDLMSSGLATEETQGCNRHQAPIKSVRKTINPKTEESHLLPDNQETVDLDSDAVLRYFREYKNFKGPTSNDKSEKQDNVQQERGDSRIEYVDGISKVENNLHEDEQRRQFERDRHELDELSQEVREFEIKKGREKCARDDHWEKHLKTRANGDGDQLKRKVSFLPSKLPIPMYGNQGNRSQSPSGDQISVNDKTEASVRNCNSTSIPDNNENEEYGENLHGLNYSKESRASLSQELKDIPYCDVPYRSLSAPTPAHPNKTELEHNVIGVPGSHEGQEHCGQLPPVGPTKKYVYAGGDLDLHASKSYIVDLIDRALSRELGTVPEERKIETVTRPSHSQNEICVEIARALQGDCCSTSTKNCSVQKEAPDYVKHLKVLRWDYLNHIQDELKKLQDLERILDTYSPRQSLPVLQSPASSSKQIKNHQTIL